MRFDAYTATMTDLGATEALPLVFFAGDTVRHGRGFHTFGERMAVQDQWGQEVASIQWGGRQADRVMVEVKGERTPQAVERLRTRSEHRCTRVDSCYDIDQPGAFDAISEALQGIKQEYKLWGEKRGDWDNPETGRTLYLGSPSSAVRMRFYEKGKQPEYRHLGRFDYVRLEVQVRPAKEARDHYATLSAEEVWGAASWTRKVASEVLRTTVQAHPAASVTRQPSLEERLAWLADQGGPTLLELFRNLGSWECVGLTLGEAVKARRSVH